MYNVRDDNDWINEQLTPHFNRKEFACKCGGKYCSPIHANIDLRLVDICEVIREHVNAPIRISSGCRCKVWNQKQGGTDNSSHMFGMAADLHCDSIGSKKLYETIQKLYKNGLIPNLRYCQRYQKKDFCHIDIDVNKKRKNVFVVVP